MCAPMAALLWSLSLLASYTVKVRVLQLDLEASLQPQLDAGDANTEGEPHAGAFDAWVPVLPVEAQYQVCGSPLSGLTLNLSAVSCDCSP